MQSGGHMTAPLPILRAIASRPTSLNKRILRPTHSLKQLRARSSASRNPPHCTKLFDEVLEHNHPGIRHRCESCLMKIRPLKRSAGVPHAPGERAMRPTLRNRSIGSLDEWRNHSGVPTNRVVNEPRGTPPIAEGTGWLSAGGEGTGRRAGGNRPYTHLHEVPA